MNHLDQYLSFLESRVYEAISIELNQNEIGNIVLNNLYKAHIENKASLSFQQYYFRTLNNEYEFINSKDFFRQFKKKYSLQGIDNEYLDNLEKNKTDILQLIRENSLITLYSKYFNQALIKYGNRKKEKDLGSFFAKLVHHFQPNEFCALDNPIRNYFKLSKESFFIAFIVISSAYKNWSSKNPEIVNNIRKEFLRVDKDNLVNHNKISNHKLLDLIFWSKANSR